MRISISTDGDSVSRHFGRCPSFTIIEIDDAKLISKQTIANPGHHPGFLPQFLQQKGVHCIIAGGIGRRAKELFNQAGIQTITGVSGSVDEVIDRVIKGTLEGGEDLCRHSSGKGYGIKKAEGEYPE